MAMLNNQRVHHNLPIWVFEQREPSMKNQQKPVKTGHLPTNFPKRWTTLCLCLNNHYPLVNVNKKQWKITMINGKIHYKWPFSIVMLVYQRVTGWSPWFLLLPPGEAHWHHGSQRDRRAQWGAEAALGGGQVQREMGREGEKKRNFKEISGEITIIWELNQTKLFIVYRC